MRKIILSINVTIDGMVADADQSLAWHFPYWNADMGRILCEQLNRADTILLGKHTYNAIADYWPHVASDSFFAREDVALADLMNRYRKIVYSKTLRHVNWNNTFTISGNLQRRMTELKNSQGKDILLLGSPTLVSGLIRLNQIDEYILWVHPVILGKGVPLFRRLIRPPLLTLTDIEAVDSGVVIQRYRVR